MGENKEDTPTLAIERAGLARIALIKGSNGLASKPALKTPAGQLRMKGKPHLRKRVSLESRAQFLLEIQKDTDNSEEPDRQSSGG